ncbi:MAG: phosphoglycerate dehydrogenase [Gemmatales bacterium]|nr:phosphoglycerate dehydrogenase [Gemmatales bacterium]MDW8387115.1 phosphoglycerate dehydrogenase [Gemmatales bacterium]
MPEVLIGPTTLTGKGPYLDILREGGFTPVFTGLTQQLTEEELLHWLPGKVAVLAGSEPYTRRVLEACPQLRVIARVGVGYDAVDLEAASERGVVVTITPGANHDAVAEHVYALMLSLAKEVARQDRLLRSGVWSRRHTTPIRGGTLGIVGLGRIGKAVAQRASAFQLRVLAYEPFPDLDFVAQHRIELCSLEKLLAESDWVSLHLPLTSETRHLMNRETLRQMKPGAFLINTARGGLVCEADLVEALRSGRLGGAALDVFENEPCRESPLFAFDNVVMTPHTAGVDERSVMDMAVLAARAVVLLSRGEWPAEWIVNPEARPRFRW